MLQDLLHECFPPCETSNNLAVFGHAAQITVHITYVAAFDAPSGSLSSLLVRCEGPLPAGHLGHDGDNVTLHIALAMDTACYS